MLDIESELVHIPGFNIVVQSWPNNFTGNTMQHPQMLHKNLTISNLYLANNNQHVAAGPNTS